MGLQGGSGGEGGGKGGGVIERRRDRIRPHPKMTTPSSGHAPLPCLGKVGERSCLGRRGEIQKAKLGGKGFIGLGRAQRSRKGFQAPRAAPLYPTFLSAKADGHPAKLPRQLNESQLSAAPALNFPLVGSLQAGSPQIQILLYSPPCILPGGGTCWPELGLTRRSRLGVLESSQGVKEGCGGGPQTFTQLAAPVSSPRTDHRMRTWTGQPGMPGTPERLSRGLQLLEIWGWAWEGAQNS